MCIYMSVSRLVLKLTISWTLCVSTSPAANTQHANCVNAHTSVIKTTDQKLTRQKTTLPGHNDL